MKKYLSDFLQIKTIDKIIVCLFGLTFLSIPLFSFQDKLYLITWFLTGALVIFIVIKLFNQKSIKVTIITISLLSFCISAIFSSALTAFVSFSFTPIFNALIIIILYTYFLSCEKETKALALLSVYVSLILFSLVFLFKYRNVIFSLNVSRLGSDFGDENDISIVLTIGFSISLFFSFHCKKWYFRVLNVLAALLFALLSFTGGSKISILIITLITFVIIAMFFGKKRWYLSAIFITLSLALIILLINLPVFEVLKDRFLNMLYSFVGKRYKGLNPDSSTAGRLEMFINGISLFLRRPLFGYGLNGYSVYSTHHSGWSHNHWSDSLCNYGIIGSIFYLIPFIAFFFKNKEKNVYSKIGIILFLISTISIALFKEKIFAYLVGLLFADANLKNIFGKVSKTRNKSNNDYTKRKIKVVEIIPSLSPVGGAETLYVNLCSSLTKTFSSEIELFIIILYERTKDSIYDRIESLGVNVYYLNKHKGIDFKCSKALRQTLKSIEPDIVHTHLDCSVTLMIALRFSRIFPIVHTFHHMVGTGFKNEYFNRFLIKTNRIYPVSVSSESAESLIKVTKKNCMVINNGVDTSLFDPLKKIESRQIDFLCVGSLKRVKNQVYAIKAFKTAFSTDPTYNIYFLGDGPLMEECINESGELLHKSIFFKGIVNDVANYMSNAKILVVPSISEGNPMVINEAFASGMYVIANKVGGIPNIIKEGVNGDLVEYGNCIDFANCMNKRIKDLRFLELKRTENLKSISLYSIDCCAKKYVELFFMLLSGK